eukprot:TRINITY_DN7539_c0_g1_i2.p1 TRINITY_DN7539_c0_g1~~TRINITY_DN7539_c0_g1_i2.p1  ORF type:complete len:382 (+),score=41.50 TRINITY_DN7539_c0_g1_i2:132-1277(+)
MSPLSFMFIFSLAVTSVAAKVTRKSPPPPATRPYGFVAGDVFDFIQGKTLNIADQIDLLVPGRFSTEVTLDPTNGTVSFSDCAISSSKVAYAATRNKYLASMSLTSTGPVVGGLITSPLTATAVDVHPTGLLFVGDAQSAGGAAFFQPPKGAPFYIPNSKGTNCLSVQFCQRGAVAIAVCTGSVNVLHSINIVNGVPDTKTRKAVTLPYTPLQAICSPKGSWVAVLSARFIYTYRFPLTSAILSKSITRRAILQSYMVPDPVGSNMLVMSINTAVNSGTGPIGQKNLYVATVSYFPFTELRGIGSFLSYTILQFFTVSNTGAQMAVYSNPNYLYIALPEYLYAVRLSPANTTGAQQAISITLGSTSSGFIFAPTIVCVPSS